MCDTMVAIVDGRVLFGKNSDRDPNEAQRLTWQPARTHRPGARLRCTHLTIAQAPATHAVALSRPFWMWGAEMGANAAGVVIGNEAVFTDAPLAEVGLTGMDLVRLALERAATAAAAVELIGELLERHGQGGGCGHEDPRFSYHSSFLVADAGGAYVVETVGRRWQAARVTGAATISNALTLPALRRHRDRLRSWVAGADARQACTLAAAGAARGPADLFAALRDHGGPRPHYQWHRGALAAPCVHAGGALASSQTTASWVAELTPTGARHWVTATAAPCLSLFKPIAIEHPIDLGPPPRDRDDGASLWWRHERFHRRAIGAPALAAAWVAARAPLEASWLAAPPAPADAFAAHHALLAQFTPRAAATTDDRPWYVRRYWRTRARRAGLAG
ncbi:MAG: C69 family dipeptidase [Kofleriaceae bacterium]|nr:C69 family dipeptidase [Kofleriaceae bacterium]MBP9171814.1 C69 family dipeptidase [Kofleriaceae bacterium]MBP9861349.1 C69 family dipeptidase [Kofleriaceae bacterium]